MNSRDARLENRLDVAGLVIAGLVDILALMDAGLLLAPGSPTGGGSIAARIEWVAANYGLTVAGLLLVPALFATATYPRPLAWLGTAEWVLSAVVTLLLAVATPAIVAGPFLLAGLLYVPWVWGSARWISLKEVC